MGIAVVLQDESGKNISDTVVDPRGVIRDVMPGPSDSAFSCVRFIDPYGDTIFNGIQARVMVSEWDKLKAVFVERDAESLWADVRKLIVRCYQEPHVYLRFIGD